MTARPNALRIGLFALLGLLLLAAAIVAVVGLQMFKPGERVLMRFSGSVYGLQVGAPVVFRGVRLGTVRELSLTQQGGQFSVPVVAELDRQQLVALAGPASSGNTGNAAGSPLRLLLQQGLSAQLATQSLLTGQLYVDLDLRPGVKSAFPVRSDAPPRSDGAVEVPTSLTRFQSLQEQLDRVDVDRISKDLAATLAAARNLVAGPEVKQVMTELTQASNALAQLAKSLNTRVPALADSARSTLQRAGDASTRVGGAADRLGTSVAGAADRVGQASDRLGAAAGRAETLLAPGSALVGSVQGAAEELQRSAAALREATSAEGSTTLGLQRAMADVARAARAVRELAEQIEQQPQSLIRGREANP